MQIFVLLVIQLKLQFNHEKKILRYSYIAHLFTKISIKMLASVTEMSFSILHAFGWFRTIIMLLKLLLRI